jgi:acyl carrier protein
MTLLVREKVVEETIAIVKRVSERNIEPTPSSEVVRDLGFDSVRVLELVAALEDHFDAALPLNELPQIKTVDQIVDKILALAEPATVSAKS